MREGSGPFRRARYKWLAVGLTLALRLAFIIEVHNLPFSTLSPMVVDSWFYHRWAMEIVSGNLPGSDVFFLRPLYPYLLALVYLLFGPKVIVVQTLQALMAAVSCLLLYRLASRFFNHRVAIIAAFGFALTGILVFYTGALLYVELTILLSLLALWLLAVAGRRWWLWVLAGVVFGLLVISRPELLALAPFLGIWRMREQRRIGPILLWALVALSVVAIVPVRNLIVAGDPVLFTAHSGINFFYGNNPKADGTWQPTGAMETGAGFSHERLKRIARTVNGRKLSWSQASAYWTRQGLKFIVSNPLRFLRLVGRKFLLFWSNYEVPNNYYPETVWPNSKALRLAFVNYGLVAALAILGMVWAWPLRQQALPAYLFVAGHLFSALIFYVLSRLRAPVLPFLLMFAGFGLNEIWLAFRERWTARFVLGIASGVALYLGSCLIPVNRQPYSSQAWTQLGNIYLERRQAGPAIEALRKALKVDPTNVSARYSLIQAYAGMRRVADAEAELAALKNQRSSLADRLALLGAARIAIARRDWSQAESLYLTAARFDPEDAETCYLLGLVYVSTERLTEAREWLARCLELDPSHDAARQALVAVARSLSKEE